MRRGMKPIHTTPFSIPSFARYVMNLSFCFFLLRVSRPVQSREFTLGFLVPYNECAQIPYFCGKMYASAITVAIEKINSDPHLLVGHNVTYIWNDTGCHQSTMIKQQLHQLNAGVDAFIGPGCHCDAADVVAEATEKTMISHVSTKLSLGFLDKFGSLQSSHSNNHQYIGRSV